MTNEERHETLVEIGGQTMTQAQFDAARFPLLASFWSEDLRTVTTVEELDALPVGSVVMASCDGDVIVARKPHPMEYPFAVAHYWDAVGTELGTDAWTLLYDRSATILYTPPK